MLSKLVLIILILFPPVLDAMDVKEFRTIMDKVNASNFDPVEKFLKDNKAELLKDPEYYVILLNYSYAKGNKEQIVVAKGKPQKGDFALEDKDTGEVVGFLGNRPNQDIELILKGISETQKALSSFNNRLDIYFGIVHIASLINRWDIVGTQLVEILRVSKAIDNQWKWGTINSMDDDPKKFMLENVQERVKQLFNAEKEEADNALKTVAEAMIKEYPDVIYGYANLGVLYLANNKLALAEKYLNQALTIDPNDKIVLGNLRILKERKND
jgi:tetratricopeptide (TPR) repeat protein